MGHIGGDSLRRGLHGGLLRLRRSTKSAADSCQRRQDCQYGYTDQDFGPLGDPADPLLESPLAAGHRGGAGQKVPGARLGAYHGQQCLPVGPACSVSQPLQSGRITAELSVPTTEDHRDPYQGIPPVDRQSYASQQAPDVVAVAVMGFFVGQDVA